MKWIAVAAAAVALQVAKPKEIVHSSTDPSFKVTLPQGYGSVAPRDAGASFERQTGREPWERIRIDIVPLGRALDPKVPPNVTELLRPLRLTSPREIRRIEFPWENLQIEGTECRWSLEGLDQASRIAWIPTAM